MENTVNTQEVLAAVEAGEATLVKTSNKGKIITGGVAVGLTAGAGLGGFLLGKHVERKKFEDRLTALENAFYGDEYFEEEEESDEDDEIEEAPAKKSKKASKKEEPEKVEGEVE